MASNEEIKSNDLSQFLRVYKMEPIGNLVSGKFDISPPLIWGIFAFLYFGVLFLLHGLVETPRPLDVVEMFTLPSEEGRFYPNLFSITYDLIGNPLICSLLIILPKYIPAQFMQLEKDGIIQIKTRDSFGSRLLFSKLVQIITVLLIPLLGALLVIWVMRADFLVWPIEKVPNTYSILLSIFGRYSWLSVFFQLIYVFIILGNCHLNPKLFLKHPDGCNGLSPFGKLSFITYSYLFIYAMLGSVGILSGGTPFEENFKPILDNAISSILNAVGAPNTVFSNIDYWIRRFVEQMGPFYLWVIFPLAVIVIFDRLIYYPHCILDGLKRKYLYQNSRDWTEYYPELTSRMENGSESPSSSKQDTDSSNFTDGVGLHEDREKLNKFVEDMHTWPISSRTFKIIAISINPLVPMLLPLAMKPITDWVSTILK